MVSESLIDDDIVSGTLHVASHMPIDALDASLKENVVQHVVVDIEASAACMVDDANPSLEFQFSGNKDKMGLIATLGPFLQGNTDLPIKDVLWSRHEEFGPAKDLLKHVTLKSPIQDQMMPIDEV